MKDKIYTKEEVFELNRKQQEAILNQREIKFSSKNKELRLVSLIVNSNPEPVVKKEVVEKDIKNPCPKCQTAMEETGAGKAGTDFKCPKCKYGITRLI